MVPEKDRSLYTKVMKNVFDPADSLNLEYLRKLPRTLGKKDRINFKKLFSEPQEPYDKMSAFGLAILAGDEARVRTFLHTKSEANFNYSDEQKQKFASNECKSDSSINPEEFIKKRLYTTKKLNPNDPRLHATYQLFTIEEGYHGRSFYSPAHLATNPDVAFQNLERESPNYLPNASEITPESRLHVIDELSAAGADFNTTPMEYRQFFLNEAISAIPFSNRSPLTAAHLDNFFSPKTELPEELKARALLHGANLETFLQGLQGWLSEDRNKLQQDLLHRAFNQILKGEIQIENICPTKNVKEGLNKIKREKIEYINNQLTVVRSKETLDNLFWSKQDINEGVQHLLCLGEEHYRTEEEKSAKLQILVDELEHLSKLKF
jgi:hypothetical protein